MKAAFVKFCQIHKDTIVLREPGKSGWKGELGGRRSGSFATVFMFYPTPYFPGLKPDEINDRLVQLWSKFPEEEKFVYSKVAKNEMLLMQVQGFPKIPPKLALLNPLRPPHGGSGLWTSESHTCVMRDADHCTTHRVRILQ